MTGAGVCRDASKIQLCYILSNVVFKSKAGSSDPDSQDDASKPDPEKSTSAQGDASSCVRPLAVWRKDIESVRHS